MSSKIGLSANETLQPPACTPEWARPTANTPIGSRHAEIANWFWKSTYSAIRGADSHVAAGNDSTTGIKPVDLEGLRATAEALWHTWQVMTKVAAVLDKYLMQLDGAGAPWTGPAAVRFAEAAGEFRIKLRDHIGNLAHPYKDNVPLPWVVDTMHHYLHWAQDAVQKIMDWYFAQAVSLRGEKTNAEGTVRYIYDRHDCINLMSRDMALAAHYVTEHYDTYDENYLKTPESVFTANEFGAALPPPTPGLGGGMPGLPGGGAPGFGGGARPGFNGGAFPGSGLDGPPKSPFKGGVSVGEPPAGSAARFPGYAAPPAYGGSPSIGHTTPTGVRPGFGSGAGPGIGGGFGGPGGIGPSGLGGDGLGTPGFAGGAAVSPAGVGGAAPSVGMPMGLPIGGMGAPGAAGGKGEEERERTTWLQEDEDIWGTDPDVPPAVLGGGR